jgi:cytochrome c peroxidase
MRKLVVLGLLVLVTLFAVSFTGRNSETASLRKIYSRPPSQWPAPTVEKGLRWTELGVLPPGPLEKQKDSLKHVIELGKALFFDTRLSESGRISCASCHQPELYWTDGKERSIGHAGALSKRNSPTIQNTWFYEKLFWDGRAKDLQDQAFAPINSETEMHSEMPDVLRKLRNVKGYKPMFRAAFGNEEITPDNFTEAIATFEKTIVSGKSRFDRFLEGDKKALNNQEVRGLHVFRTRAKCMNCHNGPLFTDNRFHQSVSSGPDDDEGRYKVTHDNVDKKRFKTPSLRDVMGTAPWMHHGRNKDMVQILILYQKASPTPFGEFKGLKLKGSDEKDLLAFLHAITAPPLAFEKPVIPD